MNLGRELVIMLYGPVGKSFDQPELLTGVIPIAGIFFPSTIKPFHLPGAFIYPLGFGGSAPAKSPGSRSLFQ